MKTGSASLPPDAMRRASACRQELLPNPDRRPGGRGLFPLAPYRVPVFDPVLISMAALGGVEDGVCHLLGPGIAAPLSPDWRFFTSWVCQS